MKLKIGRNEYRITEKDLFMDNGACIQLMTQSKEKSHWGHRSSPVLSKANIKQINKFNRIINKEYSEKYSAHLNVIIFSLDIVTLKRRRINGTCNKS